MGMQSEKAIKDKKEDKLKRNRFATNLSKNIKEYNYDESITIGLMGPWGSGKSSIINMVKHELNESNLIVVEFNPWYFAGRKQLISDFFQVLSERIGNIDETVSKLGKDLKLYSAALKPLTLIPQIGPIIALLTKIGESGGDFFKEYSKSQNEDISKIKERINDQIREYGKKILIIIDEIDRLENEDIKEIFQLVRALGDFENMIYLLSFDKEKISKIFSSGEDYLDKIINVPLYVPELSMKKVNDYFINELGSIFSDVEMDSDYWNKIYENVFKNKFENLREVNRFLNIIRFNCDDIIDDLNIVDYLMISFLKIFDEEIYKLIKNNKNILIKDSNHKEINSLLKTVELKSKKNIEFKKLIQIVFNKNRKQIRRGIKEKKYFDAYFEHSLSDDIFTIKEINIYSNLNRKEELIDFLKEMSKEDINYLFNNLNEISEKLNEQQICFFEEVLIEKVLLLDKKEKNLFSNISEQGNAFLCLKNMMMKLSNNSKNIVNVLDNLVFRKEYELDSFLKYLLKLKIHFDDKEFQRNLLVKLEPYIYNLEYSQQIRNSFGTLNEIGFNLEQYIKSIINDEKKLILYLKSLVDIVEVHFNYIKDEDGEEEYEYAIVLENITKYIDYTYVKEKVDNLSKVYREENKDLIKEFYEARPYAEVYAHLIQQEEVEQGL